jgi:Fe-S oxidoreductase
MIKMGSDNQTVENCNLCGICNPNCPIYFVLQKESAGPRFKAFLAKKKSLNELFFMCTSCGFCLQGCPARVELGCLDIRKRLAESSLEPAANREMRNNIKEHGNPFGSIKKGKKIAKYYT